MNTKKKEEKHSTVMDKYRLKGSIKKGPWTAEEDEVLVNFVNKNGPKDWSSILSSGLLPRAGKSCRLRWVNKLRPNLKIGCKFTAEEKRVVIDLQARLGNKWATIATYLPGRTDNDVKNFWSSRKKRLARILHSPSPTNKSSDKKKGKSLTEVPSLQVDNFNSYKTEEHTCSSSSTVGPQMLPLMPLQDLLTPHPINTDPIVTNQYDQAEFISEENLFSLSPHHHDSAFDLFPIRQFEELDELSQLSFGSEFKLETLPDNFFDELPDDIFKCLEPNASSSSLFS